MSHDVFFVSDTHFGHKNIMKYEPSRPGNDLEEHHEILIDLWNKRVKPTDKVFHLGDFCFGLKNLPIAGRLNGQKRLVMGNHDVYPAAEYLKYFHSLHGAIIYKQFMLTHVPVHQFNAHTICNVHGHTHSKTVKRFSIKGGEPFPMREDDPFYINVSVENIGYQPISLEEVMAKWWKSQ